MKKVVTMGLGYIGLPTSALIASSKICVHGVDINQKVVDTINKGGIHIIEKDLDSAVKLAVDSGYLKASTEPEEADVFLIVVPTPFKENYKPDISYVESATKKVIPLLKEGNLFIIESTSPVGTTQKMKNLIFSERKELEGKINIAYCPERVLPGNIMYELIHNDRVIGGINEDSTNAAILFYKNFVKGNLYPTNAKTAEMCKLVENSSRDAQIAFANELSLICDKADINVWEMIKLANKHPRVNILSPGCGVGGHCIAVDPYFILSDFPVESQMIGKAREINNFKSLWCAKKIISTKNNFEFKHKRKPITAILGLAFKPNIDDLRESPAMFIADYVEKKSDSEIILFAEPNIKSHSIFELTDYKEAIRRADIIVFLVAHDEFKNINTSKDQLILDFCGIKK